MLIIIIFFGTENLSLLCSIPFYARFIMLAEAREVFRLMEGEAVKENDLKLFKYIIRCFSSFFINRILIFTYAEYEPK